MTKMEIVDDCLSPTQFVYLTYNGANPYKVYTKITSMMQQFFEISSSGVFEDRFHWDIVGSNIDFFMRMKARRDFGKFTNMFVHMNIRGSRKKDANTGTFTLRVNSYLETNFEYRNPISKTLWYLYSYIFYNKRRRGHLEFCRNTTNDFINEIKEHFNLRIPKHVEHIEWRER